MRLLIAAEQIGMSGGGGMERYLATVLPALAAAHDLRLIARSAAENQGKVEEIRWADEHDEPSANARRAMDEAIRRFAPDVTIAHNVMDAGVVASLRAAPRSIYHVHDHRPFCPNGDRLYPRRRVPCTEPLGTPCLVHALLDGCAYGPRPRTLALVRRRERLRDAVAVADAVVVTSAYMRDRAIASRIPGTRIATVPLPLEDDAYAAAPLPSQGDQVVFAGRMVPQKGLLSLVRALASIPRERRPRLRAFGDGPDRATAQTLADRLDVALDLPGAAEPATLREAIDASALVVVPSLWAEPFGYVGVEAFARGRAVVAYDSGGIGAWLSDGRNGRVVPRAKERALAHAIAGLLAGTEVRHAFERNARGDAERFRLSGVARELFAIYTTGLPVLR